MGSKAFEEAARDLAEALPVVEVLTDTATRERYARDHSPFFMRPAAVARPANAEEVASVVEAAAVRGLPITARAGGSSVAGQCLGQGLILDLARLDSIAIESPEAVACGPGVVLDDLNAALAEHGVRIGPSAASSPFARIGGLVATNACGAHSLKYGRFGDALLAADVVTAAGEPLTLESGQTPAQFEQSLAELRDGLDAALIGWPDQHRSYGGYRLDCFAERGDPLSLLPGSEGTLCISTGITLRTVPEPKRRVLEACGFASAGAAFEAASEFVADGAVAVEFLDRHLLDAARSAGLPVPAEPDAEALLLAEYLDTEPTAPRGSLLDGAAAAAAWTLRYTALLLATDGGRIPVAVFEDPAVRPERIADFHRAAIELLDRFGFDALVYGHAAAGCLHIRPLSDPADPDLGERLQQCLPAVADLVCEYGGALTGEHGWGMARSQLAPTVLGEQLYGRFRAVKEAFDPAGTLNPGKVVGGTDPFRWFDPVS